MFLVFQSLGAPELLILLVVFGFPAAGIWAVVQALGKRSKGD